MTARTHLSNSTIVQLACAAFVTFGLSPQSLSAQNPLNPEIPEGAAKTDSEETADMDGMILPKPTASQQALSKQALGDGYYYPFRKHFVGGFGYGGFIPNRTALSLHGGYGTTYKNQSFIEMTGEIYSGISTTGGFEVRYLKPMNKTRSRPFWTAGGMILYSNKDQLVSFLKWESYELRGSFGIDYTIGSVFALRAEAILALSLGAGFRDQIRAALVWPW